VPKVVLSTIAHSHLIPPERITPDLIMVLWAGGLYGLNSLCRSALAQAAGAVVGACRRPPPRRPAAGRHDLAGQELPVVHEGLKPALEARGYEVAVFHTTGMGGRAFEDAGRSKALLRGDGLQPAGAGQPPRRLLRHRGRPTACRRRPQRRAADRRAGRHRHGGLSGLAAGAGALAGARCTQHNRLIASAIGAAAAPHHRRRDRHAAGAQAKGPSCLLLPTRGVEQWDRPGEPLHDPEGLAAFVDAMLAAVPAHGGAASSSMRTSTTTAFADAALRSSTTGWRKAWCRRGAAT
jgi:uncharacterized protein (UPF0261 family)